MFSIKQCCLTKRISTNVKAINSKCFLHLVPPYIVEDYEPRYFKLKREGKLKEKLEQAQASLKECRMCPRNCGVNRYEKPGICMLGDKAVVSSAFPHFGEEQCLQGWNGSGTIFFSGCNLRCVFCQNWDISQKVNGWKLDGKEIADLMLKLQNETECHNINFVTPEHVVPQVVEAIVEAVDMGLNVPIVYNTSSYDRMESLALMEGLVDIYMPDFKVWQQNSAFRLLRARDYPEIARAAIKEMHRQVGPLRFDFNGLAKCGLLVRHLVMPDMQEEGATIVKWIADNLSLDTFVNIMDQYSPQHNVGKKDKKGDETHTRYKEINRPVSRNEIKYVEEAAKSAGLWRFNEDQWDTKRDEE